MHLPSNVYFLSHFFFLILSPNLPVLRSHQSQSFSLPQLSYAEALHLTTHLIPHLVLPEMPFVVVKAL